MINLNPSERFIKYFEGLDVTLIEIIKADKIDDKYFLLPYGSNISKNEEIYIPQFAEGKLSHSSGPITKINNYNLTHKATTKPGSSGSPIILKGTTKVIGIHKQGNSNKKENYGTLINPVIELLQSEKNKNGRKIMKIVYSNGKTYIGPVRNELPNGEGKLYNKNNEIIYEGNFVDGIEEGEGQRITKDYKYVGQFISGKMFGEGKIYFKNGKVKYMGGFANNKKEGKGQYFFEDKEHFIIEHNKKFYLLNGDSYIGHFMNDKWNGKGIIYLKNGRIKYEGNFVDNKFEGHGKYNFESGIYYIGQWLNDMQHGKGKIYDKNGKLFYDGEFIHDMMEGNGKIYLSNDNYYVGKFKKGKLHGRGKLYYKDGTFLLECEFDNGILKSMGKTEENYKNNFNEIMMSTQLYGKRFI
jgi:hypothetical protein